MSSLTLQQICGVDSGICQWLPGKIAFLHTAQAPSFAHQHQEHVMYHQFACHANMAQDPVSVKAIYS